MEKLIILLKEGDILVFLFIFLIIMLMIITMKIKIKCENFKFKSLEKEHLEKDYKIEIIIYIFRIIPIFKFKITHKKIKKALNNEKIRKVVNKQKIEIIENKKDIDIKYIKDIKNIKIQIDEMNLNIELGTEDAAITSFIIPVISTFIALFISRKIQKYNNKQKFSIKPIYINQNSINVEFSGIFQIKMIHIINTICIVSKKKKGDKNERTSNRRSYDYGYE